MGKMGQNMAALIGPPDEESDEPMADDEGEGDKGGQEEAKTTAAKDLQDAVRGGTPEEVVSALETLIDLIG